MVARNIGDVLKARRTAAALAVAAVRVSPRQPRLGVELRSTAGIERHMHDACGMRNSTQTVKYSYSIQRFKIHGQQQMRVARASGISFTREEREEIRARLGSFRPHGTARRAASPKPSTQRYRGVSWTPFFDGSVSRRVLRVCALAVVLRGPS